MNFSFTKSSLLAAQKIAVDPQYFNGEKAFLESSNSFLDSINGEKVFKLIGGELLNNLSNSSTNDVHKKNLREIIKKYLKNEKPNFISNIQDGYDNMKEYINDENILQIFSEAGLFDEFDNEIEFNNEILEWWREMMQFSRDLNSENKTKTGIAGEIKSFNYELKRLQKLGIKKNDAHYDVLSWDESSNPIYIEAKNTENNNDPSFWLSRAQYIFSQNHDNFLIHFWFPDLKKPKKITGKDLKSKGYKIDDAEYAKWGKMHIFPPMLN